MSPPPVTALPVPNHDLYHFVSVWSHHLHRSSHICLPHTRALRLTARSRSSASSTGTCVRRRQDPGNAGSRPGASARSCIHCILYHAHGTARKPELYTAPPALPPPACGRRTSSVPLPRPPVPPSAAAPHVPRHPAALQVNIVIFFYHLTLHYLRVTQYYLPVHSSAVDGMHATRTTTHLHL